MSVEVQNENLENGDYVVSGPDGKYQLDGWHVQGFSMESSVAPICQRARERLTRREYPCFVGSTGYIHINGKVESLEDGWTVDDLGRTIFVFKNRLYFQRYMSGNSVMGCDLATLHWESVNREKAEELLNSM
jgi:hypothetical protein